MLILLAVSFAFFSLLISLGLIIFVVSLVIVDLIGVPYVPTTYQEIDQMFAGLKIRKGSRYLELGSGDGRVLRHIVQQYQLQGVGLELNPFLYCYSRLVLFWSGVQNITIKRVNFFDYSFSDADVIYCFLVPKLTKKVSQKIKAECQPGTLIISRGFSLDGLKKIKSVNSLSYPTYIYQC